MYIPQLAKPEQLQFQNNNKRVYLQKTTPHCLTQPNSTMDITPPHDYQSYLYCHTKHCILTELHVYQCTVYSPLSRAPSLKDLESLEPAFHSSLLWILENDPEPLDLTFTVEEEAFGQLSTHELKEGGMDIPVTNDNKEVHILCVYMYMYMYMQIVHIYVHCIYMYTHENTIKEMLSKGIKATQHKLPKALLFKEKLVASGV